MLNNGNHNENELKLTNLVCISHLKNIGSMYILIQCLFNQILWLISRKLRHSTNKKKEKHKIKAQRKEMQTINLNVIDIPIERFCKFKIKCSCWYHTFCHC